MADVSQVLAAFRQELVDAGLVRRPTEAGGAVVMHVEPLEGAVGPGEDEDAPANEVLVLSLLEGGTYSEAPYDAAVRRRVNVDVRSRAKTNPALRTAMALEAAIVARLIRPQTNYGFGFTLGSGGSSVYCQEVQQVGGGPISSGRDFGFDRVAKFMLEVAP